MDQAQSLIQLYQTGFYVCMGITILAFLSAVFMFFKFDIRMIFAIKTGRAAKKTIEKMAEANAVTGRLRQDEMDYQTGSLSGQTGQSTTVGETAPLNQGSAETTALGSDAKKPATMPVQAIPTGPALPPGFKFVITENQVVIHTKELI